MSHAIGWLGLDTVKSAPARAPTLHVPREWWRTAEPGSQLNKKTLTRTHTNLVLSYPGGLLSPERGAGCLEKVLDAPPPPPPRPMWVPVGPCGSCKLRLV